MLFIKKNNPEWIAVYITDSTTGLPKTGLAYTDITVKYRKYGETTFSVKQLDQSNFREIGDGIYEIYFDVELDTIGTFIISVSGSNIASVAKEVYIIDLVHGYPTLWENLR